MFNAIHQPLFKQLSELAAKEQTLIYLVGGYVRDLFLNRNSKDIDILVIGSGINFAQSFANQWPHADFAVFKNFGTAMVKTSEFEIEFVGARKESYNRESRKPAIESGNLNDDLSRRDFTINAMALSLNSSDYGQLIDPFNGKAHLAEQILMTPLEPGKTFDDDPLRMLRAIRFAAQLNFNIEANTLKAISDYASRINIISNERISEELNKILLTRQPSIGFKLLYTTGLLNFFLPELAALGGVTIKNGKAHKDNFYHTLKVVDNICLETENLWLRWAALLHDIGKAPTKKFITSEGGWTFHGHEDRGSKMVHKIFQRLKLPLKDQAKYVSKLVALHHRPKSLANDGITDSAIRRLIVDADEDLADLFTLCRADMTSRFPEKLLTYRNNLKKVEQLVAEVAERDALRNWQPPVSGQDIMEAFNIKPGKEVGIIKEEIREAILEGIIPNNKEAAMQLMFEIGKRLNLQSL